MIEVIYKPEDAGTNVMNSRGKIVEVRKYHLTKKEIELAKKRWKEDIIDASKSTKSKAGNKFYNPYRKGIYYYQIKALYLLGCNEWHSLADIVHKVIKEMSLRPAIVNGRETNAWKKFKGRSSRSDAICCKDYIGRIQENMVFFQRLTKLHPSGYKLQQAFASVDIKRVSRDGFPDGCYYYRLSTYGSTKKAFPIRDFSLFEFLQHERRYVSRKFIGTIITKDKVISRGISNEV